MYPGMIVFADNFAPSLAEEEKATELIDPFFNLRIRP
jgi:hypothetical protein